MIALKDLDRTIRLTRDLIAIDVSDLEILEQFQSFRILCVADEKNLRSRSGQAALITFVSLVARMGVQVDIVGPNIELIGPQAPLRDYRLTDGLIDLGQDLISGSGVTTGSIYAPDAVVVLGDTRYPVIKGNGWRLIGNAWSGGLAEVGSAGSRWITDWPIGGMTAALLATTETFKSVARRFPLQDNIKRRLLEPISRLTWDFGRGLPVPTKIDCGAIEVISAGAITQALMFVLLRLPGLTVKARVFDDDIAEIHNLNRCMLMRRSDASLIKVDILARYQMAPFEITPIPERFQRSSIAKHGPLGRCILVGVDDIPSRWEAQRAATDWIGIGGTSHFDTITSSHQSRQPCGGCLHPVDDPGGGPIPTVSFVSFWAGLALAVRFIRHKIRLPYQTDQQQLYLSTLRLDGKHSALWRPVATRPDCPVRCELSHTLRY